MFRRRQWFRTHPMVYPGVFFFAFFVVHCFIIFGTSGVILISLVFSGIPFSFYILILIVFIYPFISQSCPSLLSVVMLLCPLLGCFFLLGSFTTIQHSTRKQQTPLLLCFFFLCCLTFIILCSKTRVLAEPQDTGALYIKAVVFLLFVFLLRFVSSIF